MELIRALLNPTEALIPNHLEHYMDTYDRRWRGDKPYIGAGQRIREWVSGGFRAAVLRLHPGAQITHRGMNNWVETLFPGYDPDVDDCLCVMAMAAAEKLAKDGYLVRTFGASDDDWTRTRLPPFGPDCSYDYTVGCHLIEQWRRRDTALLQVGFAERGPAVPLSDEERQRQEGLIEGHLRARAAAEEKRKQVAAEVAAAKKRRREEDQARELERYWKYRKKESELGNPQRKISKRSLSEVREIIKDVVVDGDRELARAIFADIGIKHINELTSRDYETVFTRCQQLLWDKLK